MDQRYLRQNFMDPRHPHHSRQNFSALHFFDPLQKFLNQRHPRHPRQNLTHTTSHKCFPVKSAKFLETPFFAERLRWMVLYRTAVLKNFAKVRRKFM